jgi:hypothetical protein
MWICTDYLQIYYLQLHLQYMGVVHLNLKWYNEYRLQLLGLLGIIHRAKYMYVSLSTKRYND